MELFVSTNEGINDFPFAADHSAVTARAEHTRQSF